MAQIEIKCVMDSEFCKGNTWYQIRSMSDHVVYVYLDKHEFVGLPKCHFDMDNIRELKEQAMQKVIHDSDCSLHNEPAYPNGDCDCSVSTQEISKDNIVEVLKFNNIDQHRYKIDDDTIACFSDVNNVWAGTAVLFKCPEWLQIVEVYFGKLKPLPKANPFDVVKVGQWVRLVKDETALTTKKWYRRIVGNGTKIKDLWLDDDDGFKCHSDDETYWDLTDIRDYNPTECVLKIGDEIHFYNDLKYSITEINHIESKFYLGESKSITFYFGENHKIKSVNGKKYDTIIIPKFDFAQCLVDAGFKIADDCLYVGKSFDDALIWFNSSTGRLNVGMYIKPTPANAQIIVSMANLAKGIK